ncbi:hypothetical protein EDC94DRAFT_671047 [Helicostylum pulchrum]|nr:hypothetical protein EDC94DRAFT_671047 [Helicostylum pulchrum]
MIGSQEKSYICLQILKYIIPLPNSPRNEFVESVVRASELFLYDDTSVLNDYSESGLLHEVWPFVYRIFKDTSIKAALRERTSVVAALGINDDRKLEAIDKIPGNNIGAKVDILFKICNTSSMLIGVPKMPALLSFIVDKCSGNSKRLQAVNTFNGGSVTCTNDVDQRELVRIGFIGRINNN